MKIQDKLSAMDLDQVSKFLQKPIGVTFKKKGLQCPQVTWIKHGYQGEISLQELAQKIFEIYKRDQKTLQEKSFSPLQERTIRYYQIEKGRDLIKTVQSAQASIEKMWWKHSYLAPFGIVIDKFKQKKGSGKTLEEVLEAFAATLNVEERKLDRESAKYNARAVFNEYADFFNHIFHSFSFSFHPHDFVPQQKVGQSTFNPYQVLGLAPDATASEIKKKYHQLALKIHPDKNSDPKAAAKFQELQKAYDVLSHPEKRARYDRFRIVD